MSYVNHWQDYTIRVIRLKSGQPRPYADHEHEAELHYSSAAGEAAGVRFCPPESLVKQHAKALVLHWEEPPRDWAAPTLREFKELRPGVWRVRITEAYTD